MDRYLFSCAAKLYLELRFIRARHIQNRHLLKFCKVTHWHEVLSQGNLYRERRWARSQVRKHKRQRNPRTCNRLLI